MTLCQDVNHSIGTVRSSSKASEFKQEPEIQIVAQPGDLLKTLGNYLGSCGIRTTHHGDLDAGLAWYFARKRAPQLVLFDLATAGPRAEEFLSLIKTKRGDQVIAFIAVGQDWLLIERLLRAGADKFFALPLDTGLLGTWIYNHITIPQ